MEDPETEGPVVTDEWVTSREAVLAFDRFCARQKWVFTETPQQSDFGKDGYVDFSREGELTGECVAVQIKGGASHRRSDGYVVTADERRRLLWMESTIAVFAVVWDPDSDELYWLDLTRTLRAGGIDARLHVPVTNRLDPGNLTLFTEAVFASTTTNPVVIALGSDDEELEEAAVFDCWALGRRNPEHLVLLRRVMFGLQPAALDSAIYVLNGCSLNMDIWLDPKWMSLKDRSTVRAHYRWTVDEAVALLERVQDEDGFQRGSFSTAIYWLLVGPDPAGDHYVDLVEAATLRAAEAGKTHAAAWGLVLRVYWAGEDGPAVFQRLLAAQPGLAASQQAQEISVNLRKWGRIEL